MDPDSLRRRRKLVVFLHALKLSLDVLWIVALVAAIFGLLGVSGVL